MSSRAIRAAARGGAGVAGTATGRGQAGGTGRGTAGRRKRPPLGALARRAARHAAPVAVAVAVPLFGAPLALHATGEAAAPGAAGIAVLRAVLFAALCVPVGEVFAAWLARRAHHVPDPPSPPGLTGHAAAAGFVAALGLACVVSAGNLVPHRLFDLDAAGLYGSRDGVLALVEVNAFLLAALWRRSRRAVSRVLPAAAVVAAEALRAHPGTEPAPLAGSALTAVHLTCAVLWAGGLWQVLRTIRFWRAAAGREPGSGVGTHARPTLADPAHPALSAFSALSALSSAPPPSTPPTTAPSPAPPPAAASAPASAPARSPAAALLAGYARVAAVLLVLLALTGTVSAVRRMPPATLAVQTVTTAYGRTLLVKVLLVAVAAALALSARLLLRATSPRVRAPEPARGRARRSARRAGRTRDPLAACVPARRELVVLGLVVAVSALLTALPVPLRW